MDHRFKMLALDCGLLEGNANLVSPDQRNECMNEQQQKKMCELPQGGTLGIFAG